MLQLTELLLPLLDYLHYILQLHLNRESKYLKVFFNLLDKKQDRLRPDTRFVIKNLPFGSKQVGRQQIEKYKRLSLSLIYPPKIIFQSSLLLWMPKLFCQHISPILNQNKSFFCLFSNTFQYAHHPQGYEICHTNFTFT